MCERKIPPLDFDGSKHWLEACGDVPHSQSQSSGMYKHEL